MTADTFRFFREDLCNRCGNCFAACPYLELPQEKAKQEINNLIEQGVSLALEVCNTCHTCDAACPNGADPYELVLERWSVRNEKGLPRHRQAGHAVGTLQYLVFIKGDYAPG